MTGLGDMTAPQILAAWEELSLTALAVLTPQEQKEWVMLGRAAGKLSDEDAAFFFYALDIRGA